MNEDVTLTYDIFEQKNVSFKTMKIYSIQNTQLERFKRNIENIEYETNTKIEFNEDKSVKQGFFEGQDNTEIIINGFDYNIDQAIDIIDKDFTNIYEQILDFPLIIKSYTVTNTDTHNIEITGEDSGNREKNSVFVPDFIKKYKMKLESYFNISIEEVSQPDYNEWSMRGINTRGDVFW